MRFPRWAYVSALALLMVVFVATLWAYPRLPDPVVIHWGPAGQPDGFLPRSWGAWLLPGLLVALAGLFFGLVPVLEPWQANLQRFRGAYAALALGVLGVLALTHAWVLAWNLGWQADIRRFLGLVLAGLNGLLAWLLPRARPNWFMGVRTPWTLSSPRVWRETHRAAVWVFGPAAGLALGAVVWPGVLFVAVAWMVLGSFALTGYSFVLYRRYQRAYVP